MTKQWPNNVIEKIASTDDFHIAPYYADGKTTGTLTWIWSVVVGGHLYVRSWNGIGGKWYRSALAQRAGKISVSGSEYEVEFTPVDDAVYGAQIDDAYKKKYGWSAYYPPMVAAGPKAATMEVTPK